MFEASELRLIETHRAEEASRTRNRAESVKAVLFSVSLFYYHIDPVHVPRLIDPRARARERELCDFIRLF